MFATLFAIGAGFAHNGIRQHLTSRFEATPTWSRTRLRLSGCQWVVFSLARPCGFQHLRAGAAFCLDSFPARCRFLNRAERMPPIY
jgi:hypothetical protein